jgi:hypothetical protein
MKQISIICWLLFGTMQMANSQNLIKDLIITTDSMKFSLSETSLQHKSQSYLYFVLSSPSDEVEITVIPAKQGEVLDIELVESSAYSVIDALTFIDGSHYSGTIRFNNILQAKFPRLILHVSTQTGVVNQLINLYPFLFPKPPDINPLIELYNGQELTIPILFEHQYFVEFDNRWRAQGILEYKLSKNQSGAFLNLRSNSTGSQNLHIVVKSTKPFLDTNLKESYDLFEFNLKIRAVTSTVNYLNFVGKNYFFEPQGSKPIMVQFDYNKKVELNRTYRIEDQEQPGGRLIGEIFTRAVIENKNKIIASLRTYSLHREENGLLYIKKDDLTKFYTNFNILKKPSIAKVSILRPGKDWNTSLSVFPGERVEVKVEGEGLENSRIKLSDGKYRVHLDTSRVNDHVLYYEVTIPADVEERSLPISLNDHPTSHELLISEFQRPRQLDFVTIDYGTGEKSITSDTFIKPALFQDEIGDLIIRFHNENIDSDKEFYGIQHLNIEIRYWDKNKKLIEQREVRDVKIIPGNSSPRFAGYSQVNASANSLQLNDVMVNKTYDLRPWSRIEIVIEHNKSRYQGVGYSHRIEVYRSDNYTVDIEVSFPAGLLVKNINEPGVGALTGLSVASMAQFSFYKKNRINKLQPLKLGLGFIAINAFSTLTGSDGTNNDIGVVSLLSFRPLKPESKVNFPIYAGFGYLFKNESLFILIGPGIQFNF